jgi:DNA polymerase-3 subunit gamma/tau
MENFIVSARKYRPATFDSVVGQGNITTTLKNAIRNKQLAQAFLFTGPRGVGKTTCARILAKTINCMNLPENIEPCDQCESCVSFNKNASFNIHELDAASNNSVEDIRNLVDQVRIPPQVGRYKVYIIDEVHMLSSSAFNAFLKTLEEPPEYAKFILATTEKHKIIPTILSRCQIYDFRRINIPDTILHLKYVAEREGVTTEEMALNVIAQKADGALRDALSIFDQLVSFAGKNLSYELVRQNLNVLDFEYFINITASLVNNNISKALLLFNEIIESGFDGQHFMMGLGDHLRNILVCKDPSTIRLLEVGDTIREAYQKQAAGCPVDFLLKALDAIQKTDFTYKSSNNKRLHLEIALLQMAAITQPRPAKTENQQTLLVDEKKKTELSTGIAEKPAILPVSNIVKPEIKPAVPENKPGFEQQAPKPAPSPAKGFFPGTISIKQEVKVKPVEEKDVEIDIFDTDSDEFLNSKSLKVEDVEEAWKEFAEKIAQGQPNLMSTLLSSKPYLGDGFEVKFEVKNSLQEKEIDLVKGEMALFLRERLNNRFIRIKIEINLDVENVRPYRPEEIFKHMAEKNPAIIKLRQRFGLEPDY